MTTRIPALLFILASAVFLTSSAIGQNAGEEPLLRARIVSANSEVLKKDLEKSHVDVLEVISPTELDVVVTQEGFDQLLQRGLSARVIERGRPLRDIWREQQQSQSGQIGIAALPVGYRDLNGIYARMQEIAAANPSIAQFVDLTAMLGTPVTAQGRHMFALKISDNVTVDEDEPALLIVADHHAREITTPVIALDAAERLTSGYGTDPRITAAVNNNEIWIAPTWNPDGYNHVVTVENFWRKNRRVFTQTGIGVDQNRNYRQGWSASCSGDTSPSSDGYKGPMPASESETQTMEAWSKAVRFTKVIDYHSTGREVLFSYLCSTHPHTAWMRTEAVALSQASGYNGVVREPSAEGEHYEWQFAQMGAYAFLIETHTTFQPPFASAQTESNLVWPGILRVLERAIPLSGHVTDVTTGLPVSAKVEMTNVTYTNGETNSSGGPFGEYHFFGPAGTYNVRFSAPGYKTTTRSIAVTASTATVVDVQLEPGTGSTEPVTVFVDDFETNKGWVVNPSGTDTATTGKWERGDPQQTSSGGVKQLGTTTSGVNDLVTGRTAGSSTGSNDIDGGTTSIQSPAIVLPTGGTLTLSFNYYLAHDNKATNADYVRVRIVGTTTQTVFESRGASSVRNAVWTPVSVSLNAFAGQTVRILIDAADAATASLVEAAVDDVKIVQQP